MKWWMCLFMGGFVCGNTVCSGLKTREYSTFVTGFGKTISVRTRIKIHFIAYYNSHTQALSRHSDTIAIDKKVCFYRCLFADSIKPCMTNTDPVGPVGCTNRVACGLKLFHLMSGLLMVWSGLLWPFVWPTVHTTWLAVFIGIINPPTHSLYVALVILQAVFKTSLKISQSIQ